MGVSEPMTPEREAVLRDRAANMRCEPENVNLNTLTCKLCKRSWWFAAESKYDPCQVKLRHAPLDLQDAFKEIDRLRESEAALIKERERLRTSIRNQAGDNLCWLDNSGVTKIPEQAEFLESCRRYHAQVSGSVGVLDPGHMTIAQLEAEIERLRAEQYFPPNFTAERLRYLADYYLSESGEGPQLEDVRFQLYQWAAWLKDHLKQQRNIPGLPEGMQIKRIYERHGIGIMCELEPKSFTCTKI